MSGNSRAEGLVLVGLLLVCLSCADGQETLRLLLQKQATANTRASSTATGGGTASASVSATAREGDVTAVVESNSESFTDVTNDLVEIVKTAVAMVEAGEDVSLVANEQASAVGTAIATAWANVVVQATSTGSAENIVCAEGSAEAAAVATAFARAFVTASIEACSGNELCATADGTAESIASGTAEAFATAQASGCVTGVGALEASQDSLAEAVVDVYANAIVDLFAEAAGGSAAAGSTVAAESTMDGDVTATGQSDVQVQGDAAGDATGTADATVTQNTQCKDAFGICCRSRNFRRRGECTCGRRGCKLTLLEGDVTAWQLDEDINVGTSRTPEIVEAGFICVCKN